MNKEIMGFGSEQEWISFNQNFPKFVETYPALEALRDKTFQRSGIGDKLSRTIFGLGRVCSEDFQQSLLLCGNGFGIGAMQMVRGMYERQVTASYLSSHPEEVDSFLNYHFVQRRKAKNHLKEAYRGDAAGLERIIPKELQEEIELEFENVKEQFTETICEPCEKTRIMLSWSKHHTGVLASKGKQDLHQLYYYQYFRPTMYSHSTVSSLLARMVLNVEGHISFEAEGQRRHVEEALIGAHNLLLNVFDLQNKHFELGLQADIDQCFEDYKACWKRKDARPESEAAPGD